MYRLLIISLLTLITACSRPNINQPKDIIAVNCKAAIYLPKLKKFFDALPEPYTHFAKGFRGVIDENKAAALVVTSVEPYEIYLAVPSRKDYEESLKSLIEDQLKIKCETWSGYIFVKIAGELPTSFGNEEFIADDEELIIYGKSKLTSLLTERPDIISKLQERKRIPRLRLNEQINRILTRFLTHELVDFTQDITEVELKVTPQKLDLNLKLKPESKSDADIKELSSLNLPAIPEGTHNLSFALSVNPANCSFPLNGIEKAYRSHLVNLDKTESIFPMDTVFEKLKESGEINGVGYLNFAEGTSKGEALFNPQYGENFFKSIQTFFKSTWYLTEINEQKDNLKGVFPAPNLDPQVAVRVDHKSLNIHNTEKSSIEIHKSAEKGLFKLKVRANSVFPYSFEADLKAANGTLKLTLEKK